MELVSRISQGADKLAWIRELLGKIIYRLTCVKCLVFYFSCLRERIELDG